MSVTQIEAEIAKFTPDELVQVQALVATRLQPAPKTVTPEMLAERHQLLEETMNGAWSADLPPWEVTRALEKHKDPWNAH